MPRVSAPILPSEPLGPARPVTERRARDLGVFVDVAVVFAVFAGLGAIGALLWRWLTPLPYYVKVESGGSMAPEVMTRQVGIDGWFFVIALVLGLLAGVALTWWARREPVLTVLAIVLSAALASFVMVHLGRALGPGDVAQALARAKPGAHIPVPLQVHATGVIYVWMIAGAFGALVQIFIGGAERAAPRTTPSESERTH